MAENKPHRPIRLKLPTGYSPRHDPAISRYRRFLVAASLFPIVAAALVFGGLGRHGESTLVVAKTEPVFVMTDGIAWSAGPSNDARVAAPQTPADEPVSEPQTTPAPTPAPATPFSEYEVVEGDTLNSIAANHGVALEDLLWNNPLEVQDPDNLLIGQKLIVPSAPGLIYYVQVGDTLNGIAALYGIDPAGILAFEGNNIDSTDMISEGAPLLLPGAAPLVQEVVEEVPADDPVIEATPAPTPEPTPVPPRNPVPAAVPVATPVPTPPPSAPAPAPVVSAGYVWPVAGPINSYFGPRWGGFHTGIDIGAAYGTAVGAAAAGQVVLTVYSDAGYGHYVVIRHADGSQTLYAHLSAIWVTNGQNVSQGEGIGAIGCTGWCTGNHLHFEVISNGVKVDPLLYLP